MHYPSPFADRSLTPSTATLRTALGNPAFFRAVSYKAAMESSTRRYVAQRTPDGVKRHLDHPVSRMLAVKMNGYATPNRTLHTGIVHRETTGNGYLFRRPRPDGETWLCNVDPSDVVPFALDDVKYFWRVSERRAYLADEVLHLMRFSLDGIVGLDPREIFAPTFGFATALNTYAVRYFKRNTVISGVIQCPAGVTLTPEQHETAAADLATLALSSSSDRRYDVPFLPFGLQWQNTAPPSNEHTKLFDALDLTERQISQLTDLPPAVLFAKGALGDLEDINADVVQSVLRTDFEEMEQEFLKLLTPDEIADGYFVTFDEDSLLRGNRRRIDQLVKEVNAGTLLVNEYRDEQDREHVEGGDVPRMPHAVAKPISEGGADNKPDETKQETGGTGGAQADTFAAGDAGTPTLALNGAQIQAALSIVIQLRQGVVVAEAALELLIAVGLDRAAAERSVNAMKAAPALPEPKVDAGGADVIEAKP